MTYIQKLSKAQHLEKKSPVLLLEGRYRVQIVAEDEPLVVLWVCETVEEAEKFCSEAGLPIHKNLDE